MFSEKDSLIDNLDLAMQGFKGDNQNLEQHLYIFLQTSIGTMFVSKKTKPKSFVEPHKRFLFFTLSVGEVLHLIPSSPGIIILVFRNVKLSASGITL